MSYLTRLAQLQVETIYVFAYIFRYVLLKERNMLMTMEEEYKRQSELFPSPERLEKVCFLLICWMLQIFLLLSQVF